MYRSSGDIGIFAVGKCKKEGMGKRHFYYHLCPGISLLFIAQPRLWIGHGLKILEFLTKTKE